MFARIPYILFVLLMVPVVHAQTMNDLGMMGESGIVLSPTTGVTPMSHFRFDLTRISFHRSGTERLNSLGLSTGLSTNMEFTVKFQTFEPGGSLTPSTIGFGGKFVSPFDLPFISRSAVWAEIMTSAVAGSSSFIPSSVTRGSLIFQPEPMQFVNGNIFLGITTVDKNSRMLFGGNCSYIVNEMLKVGGELQYNYFGNSDFQWSMLLLLRAHPNFCVQLSPGYLHTTGSSSWMLSLGISLSSTNVFFVAPEQPKAKENAIPSFDELEKQLREEKKEK